jgi:hypothetical protein
MKKRAYQKILNDLLVEWNSLTLDYTGMPNFDLSKIARYFIRLLQKDPAIQHSFKSAHYSVILKLDIRLIEFLSLLEEKLNGRTQEIFPDLSLTDSVKIFFL